MIGCLLRGAAVRLESRSGFLLARGRRVIPVVAGTVALSLFLTLAVILKAASLQDRAALELSHQLTMTVLAETRQELARTVADYAGWGDAYRHLHPAVDAGWAYDEGNLGRSLYEALGCDLVLVIDPGGRTAYAVLQGRQLPADAYRLLTGGLDRLVDQARAAPAGTTVAVDGVLEAEGVPALVAAAAISPGDDATVTPTPGPPSVLVLVKVLGQQRLREIGAKHFVEGLRLRPPDAAAGPAQPLAAVDGSGAGVLTWDPSRPGHALLRDVLPWLLCAIVTLAALTAFVLRHAWATMRALEMGQRALTASEARFKDVAEAASDWIWETDAELRFTYLSSRLAEVTGHQPEALIGTHHHAFLRPHEDGEGAWIERWAEHDRRRPFRDLLCRYRDAAGRTRYCRLAGRPLTGAGGSFAGYRGTASDVTAEVEAHAKVRHLSLHDELTGLPNRAMLRQCLEQQLAGLRQHGLQVAVLCVDLDHFKAVNDTLGHAAGDALLQEVTARLCRCVRRDDLVARLGGDEFAIVQAGVRAPSEIEGLCRRLIDCMAAPIMIEGREAYVGLSIGVATAPVDGSGPEALLRHADIALYQAKAEGGGSFRFFAPAMNERLQRRRELEFDLRRAEAEGELLLHFQTRCSTRTLAPDGVEALLRWQHPEHGLIHPDRFVPLAEETGLIVPIGAWVLHEACRQMARLPGLFVSVNLSPVQFRRGDLLAVVESALATSGLAPGRLELEITEGVLLENSAASLQTLHRLRALGVRLAMDDFGTGYSSLRYLQSFPFDCIKIDRQFVAALGQGRNGEAIVRAVLGLGRGLGIATTAEGVETEAQLAFLRQEGCDEVQGFLLGHPQPMAALLPTLLATSRPALQAIL